MGCETYKSVPTATLTRLPIYYRYLINLQQQGEKNISSAKISADMNLSAVQVRKDLACVSSIAGKPKTGFDVDELIKDEEIKPDFNDEDIEILDVKDYSFPPITLLGVSIPIVFLPGIGACI